MGTLFLQHRVEKLQDDVEQLQCRRKEEGGGAKRGKCSWGGGWRAGGCHGKKKAKDGLEEKTSNVEGGKTAILSPPSSMSKQSITPEAKRIIVADVSLLIYSLRTIHNWLKEGDCRIVVPMEALRTLDVLKKGDHYLNLAARKATRFLDERFMCERGQTAGTGTPLVPGLVAQKESEKVTCSEWKSLEHTINKEGLQESLSGDEIRQLSCSLRETMACSLYFLRELVLHPSFQKSQTEVNLKPQFFLALALPPPHFDCTEDVDGMNGQWIKYGQRADGNALLQIAKHLQLDDSTTTLGNRLIVAPTAASWLNCR